MTVVRARLYALAGMHVSRDVAFEGKIKITCSDARGLGRRFIVKPGAVFGLSVLVNLDETVTIGRNVAIGPDVRIYTGEHQLGPAARRMDPRVTARPVTIDNGAWIGAGAVILPGVHIGGGAVVAAGSLVTKDVPPNVLVRGVPAVTARELGER